jgi:ribonuclease HII
MDSLAIESSWLDRGASLIAGTDEVGRGAWAGPVVAGMVAVPRKLYYSLPDELHGIDDSKRLSPQQRALLAPRIMAHVAWGLGAATSREIAESGFAPAMRMAYHRAYQELLTALPCAPDVLITDAVQLPQAQVRVDPHPRADQRCLSVAMASILAKVHRDRLMRRFDPVYPLYDFANNKGYGTGRHQEALFRFGPCAVHRASFRPVMLAVSQLLKTHSVSSAHSSSAAAFKDEVRESAVLALGSAGADSIENPYHRSLA